MVRVRLLFDNKSLVISMATKYSYLIEMLMIAIMIGIKGYSLNVGENIKIFTKPYGWGFVPTLIPKLRYSYHERRRNSRSHS